MGEFNLFKPLPHPEVSQPGAEVGDRHELVGAVLGLREGLGPVPAEVGQKLAHGRDVDAGAAALQPGNGTMAYCGQPFEVRYGQALALPKEANPGPKGGLLKIGDDDQAISDCFSNEKFFTLWGSPLYR